MIILLFLAIGLVCLALAGVVAKKRLDSAETALNVIGVCSLIVMALLTVIALISYPCSLNNISNMENFYERNHQMFVEAVGKYPNAVTVKTKDDTTETVRLSWDYTKKVLDYNNDVKWYKKYQDHWFYGVFVGKIPEKLDFVQLK